MRYLLTFVNIVMKMIFIVVSSTGSSGSLTSVSTCSTKIIEEVWKSHFDVSEKNKKYIVIASPGMEKVHRIQTICILLHYHSP
jgi:hypothetical protein